MDTRTKHLYYSVQQGTQFPRDKFLWKKSVRNGRQYLTTLICILDKS